MDELIKEAFSRVKQDVFSLGEELSNLKLLIADMKNELKIITKALNDMREKEILTEKAPETMKKSQIQTPTHKPETPTNRQINQTQEEIPTDKLLSQVLRSQKIDVSIGNQWVPTDKQTNRQTNQQIIQHINKPYLAESNTQLTTTSIQEIVKKSEIATTNDHFDKVTEILNTLDSLKKEIRLKFKRLTAQEIAVFSMLYSMENEGEEVNYQLLSSKLSLSESSIRDYILKIQKKGVPIIKEKRNNKTIILHISPELKKIASLDTILKLREI